MQNMMDTTMGGPMMWAMGLFCIVLFAVLTLAVIALVKYLFFRSGHNNKDI